MAYTQKPGDGSLFINKKKTKDNHPDRTGSALIHCPQCSHNFTVQIAGWGKEKQDGEKWLSMQIKAKEDPGAYHGPKSQPDPSKRQHDLSKPRHMPPPPLHNKEPEKYIPAKSTDPDADPNF